MMYDNSLVGTGLESGGFSFELRRHSWSTTSRTVFEQKVPVLGLVLGGHFDGEGCLHAGRHRTFNRLGRMTFTPPSIPFEVRGTAGQALVASFRIAPQLFERVAPLASWDEDRLASVCCDVRGTPIESALMRMAREAAAPGLAADVLLEAAGAMVTVELARYLEMPSGRPDAARRRFSSRELAEIEEIVTCDPGASLSEIAERCGASVRTLTRIYKASTGRTVGDLVAEIRIGKAKNLLQHSGLPLKTIAHQAGFASTSGFCSAFQRTAGISPGSYRAQFTRFGLVAPDWLQ